MLKKMIYLCHLIYVKFQLVKKANKRKEEEPDFDKKKLNLSIHVNEKNTPDYDKENEYFFSRSFTKRNDGHFKK